LLGLLPAAPASECTEVEKNCRGAKRTALAGLAGKRGQATVLA